MNTMNPWKKTLNYFFRSNNAKNGCAYHNDCDTCPFPACTLDGYDPTLKNITHRTDAWSAKELEHLKELTYLDLPLDVMENIFRRSPNEIKRVILKHKFHTLT